MNKVTGTLRAIIATTCPNCDQYLDLFDARDAGDVNEEGYLWKLIEKGLTIRKSNPWKSIGLEVTCEHCKKDFIFDELEY